MPFLSGFHGFWWEVTVVWLGVTICNVSMYQCTQQAFISVCFNFFLWFRFQKLNCYILAWVSLYLSSMGFVQLLESIGLCLLPNSGNFQPLFFHIPFHSYALFSLRDLGIWMLDICCVDLQNIGYLLCRSMKLCSSFFQSIFFLLFIWGKFYWAVIKSIAWHTGQLLMNETKKDWFTGLLSIWGSWSWFTINLVSPVEW